jgi:hypothetical protein
VFVVSVNFIMLNMFTAVVVDTFQSVASVDKKALTLEDFRAYKRAWVSVDPKATGRIHIVRLLSSNIS